jgi:acid phosphatase class B
MKKILLILLITIMFIPVNVSFAAITPSSFKPANIAVRDDGTYYSYTDSSKTVHQISYAQIDNSKKGLKLLFSYIDNSVKFNETTKPNPNKDGCLKIEHFENVSCLLCGK